MFVDMLLLFYSVYMGPFKHLNTQTQPLQSNVCCEPFRGDRVEQFLGCESVRDVILHTPNNTITDVGLETKDAGVLDIRQTDIMDLNIPFYCYKGFID